MTGFFPISLIIRQKLFILCLVHNTAHFQKLIFQSQNRPALKISYCSQSADLIESGGLLDTNSSSRSRALQLADA
jgi:hypothetical protein